MQHVRCSPCTLLTQFWSLAPHVVPQASLEWTLGAEPRVTPEYHWVWFPKWKQNKKLKNTYLHASWQRQGKNEVILWKASLHAGPPREVEIAESVQPLCLGSQHALPKMYASVSICYLVNKDLKVFLQRTLMAENRDHLRSQRDWKPVTYPGLSHWWGKRYWHLIIS